MARDASRVTYILFGLKASDNRVNGKHVWLARYCGMKLHEDIAKSCIHL
jgi:hypothetical protein